MMTAAVRLPTVGDMSRRQATADQLVWRALAVLLVLVVLWLALTLTLRLS